MIRRPRRSTLFPSPTLSGSEDEAGHECHSESDPDPAADAEGRADSVPREEPEEELAEAADGARLRSDRAAAGDRRSEEHTSELQSPCNLVCRLLLEKKNKQQ